MYIDQHWTCPMQASSWVEGTQRGEDNKQLVACQVTWFRKKGLLFWGLVSVVDCWSAIGSWQIEPLISKRWAKLKTTLIWLIPNNTCALACIVSFCPRWIDLNENLCSSMQWQCNFLHVPDFFPNLQTGKPSKLWASEVPSICEDAGERNCPAS